MRRIIHAVRGWISGNAPKSRGSAIVYVYAPGKEAPGGELGPNDQIAVLRRLSTFTSKESIPVTIIFPGRPSRKIPDGTTQGDVQARYATGDQMKKVVLSALADARKSHSPVLATNLPEMEKVASSERVRYIRASTFEETLDSVCGPLRREQPQQQQQPRRQQQPQQPAQNQSQGQPQQVSKPQPVQPEETGEAAPQTPVVDEVQTNEPAADIPAPAPRPEFAPRKLQRYEPSAKKEIKDQAILDLIDPL